MPGITILRWTSQNNWTQRKHTTSIILQTGVPNGRGSSHKMQEMLAMRLPALQAPATQSRSCCSSHVAAGSYTCCRRCPQWPWSGGYANMAYSGLKPCKSAVTSWHPMQPFLLLLHAFRVDSTMLDTNHEKRQPRWFNLQPSGFNIRDSLLMFSSKTHTMKPSCTIPCGRPVNSTPQLHPLWLKCHAPLHHKHSCNPLPVGHPMN